jgi:transcriptional regulator with XRE-family HTH domain
MKRITKLDANIGHKIRELRLLNGYAQWEIGKLLGISFQQIQKYERGKNRISASNLYRLAVHFGTDFDYFFNSYQKHRNEKEKQLTTLLKYAGKLSKKEINAISKLARAFVKKNQKR